MTNILLRYFSSITVLRSRDEPEEKSPREIAEWAAKYLQWFADEAGLSAGRNFQLLYGRSLAVVGSGLYDRSDLEPLFDVASTFGLGTSVQLVIEDYLANPELLDRRLAEWGKSGVMLDGRSLADSPLGVAPETRQACSTLISALMQAGVSMTLIGAPSMYRRLGLLGLESLNSINFQLHPAAPRPQVQTNYFDPCQLRFQLFVSPTGGLYPCAATVGQPGCSLGHIDAGLPTMDGLAPALDIDRLARQGPEIDPARREVAGGICARHLAMLAAGPAGKHDIAA